MTPTANGDGDLLAVTRDAVEVGAVISSLADPAYGATASFLGSVRTPNRGVAVRYIDYEGYEAMIRAELERLAHEVRARFPLGRLAVVHRLGRIRPGEVSLLVAVASPHRDTALHACEELVEAIKARLPVWKYEVGPERAAFVAGRSDAGPTL